MLVPSAVVVEVLNKQLLKPTLVGAPDWQVGLIDWREKNGLKVISFEGVCGMAMPEVRGGANVVIMKSLDQQHKNRYYGIYVNKVPTVRFADEASLAVAPDQSGNADSVASRVLLNGVEGYIPDLDKIETLLF